MRINIEKKHVDLDTRCAVCNTLFESGGHLFVACREASKVWDALSMGKIRHELLECGSAMELMDHVLALPYEEK
jgi:hypothetical protein